jgi:hypothetical protein
MDHHVGISVSKTASKTIKSKKKKKNKQSKTPFAFIPRAVTNVKVCQPKEERERGRYLEHAKL